MIEPSDNKTSGNGLPMTTSTMLKSRYMTDSVETMSPARLVIALYDRLSLDLERAQAAIEGNDVQVAHDTLVHAQDIVSALHTSLDTTLWPAGAGLAALYEYLGELLVLANVHKDGARVAECRAVVEPLRDAWKQAATAMAVEATTSGTWTT
jgi:flagellar protein FliS